jgi:DNA modification methylase
MKNTMPEIVRLIHGSSTEATQLCPDLKGKVALVVTSPPYHNAISYDSHTSDSSENYRPRQETDYEGVYLKLLDDVWDQMWEMLVPGGYLAINVGTVLDQGHHFPLPQDIISRLMHSNREWKFVRSIIWHKVTAGVKRAGSVIKHQLPGYWYPNIMTEHIIIVRKKGPVRKLNSEVPSVWWDQVWDLAPVPPRFIDHPAPFPEDIPHRLIRMLTQPGEWVVDPFNGAGSTTKAAYDLQRYSVGFDLEEKYISLAEKRLSTSTTVRSSQIQIAPISARDFVPGKTRGETRHGAGLGTRRRPK